MPTSPSASPLRFAELMQRVARGLARVDRQHVCCADYTRQQFETLRAIGAAGALTTGALAEHLKIDLSTASRNLALLERDHCIARRRDEADARSVVNVLTAKGGRCSAVLAAGERAAFATVFRAIPPARRARTTETLLLLADALDSLGGSDACCTPGAAGARSGACP